MAFLNESCNVGGVPRFLSAFSHHLPSPAEPELCPMHAGSVLEAIKALGLGSADAALSPGFLADWTLLGTGCGGFHGSLFLLPFSFVFK